MRVLSLFDGLAGGYEALKRAGIYVTEYHAFEIDKYAIQIAKKNHPDIIHHGEINFMTDFSRFKGFDLLIGGSPCQGFSHAGKGLNFQDPRSQLFFEYIRAKNTIKPKYFMLENVKMKKEWLDIITQNMGVEPVLINSALVSAQNRNRFYWCNWKVEQPEDRGILLKDIIEDGIVDRDKSYCIDANYFKGGNPKNYFDKSRRQLVFIAAQRGRNIVDGKRCDYFGAPTEQRIEPNLSGKSNCLTSVQKDNLICIGMANINAYEQRKRVYSIEGKAPTLLTPTGGNHQIKIALDEIYYRNLTPIECARLQTLPDDYCAGVSNSQQYKMIGNGWNIETIKHIFQGIKNGK